MINKRIIGSELMNEANSMAPWRIYIGSALKDAILRVIVKSFSFCTMISGQKKSFQTPIKVIMPNTMSPGCTRGRIMRR
jgi:hypothetical protein